MTPIDKIRRVLAITEEEREMLKRTRDDERLAQRPVVTYLADRPPIQITQTIVTRR